MDNDIVISSLPTGVAQLDAEPHNELRVLQRVVLWTKEYQTIERNEPAWNARVHDCER